MFIFTYYRQASNISRTLVGNKIVDHSDVVGASPVGAAPTTSSFSLRWRHNGGDSVSNHQPHDCLLNRLFGRRSK